jgi:diguanylate cyclase (GGDEF)-like protein
MTALRALAERETERLEQFRNSDRAQLMIRLAHTECLLELARLSVHVTDVSTFSEAAVSIVDQFLPVRWSQLSCEIVGVPPISVRRGDGADGQTAGGLPLGALCSRLALGDQGSGVLTCLFEFPDLGSQELVDAVSEQVASGLLIVSESERIRRQAALGDAARLIHGLGDEPTGPDLRDLVEAMSYLPKLSGVNLRITHPAVGGHITLASGQDPQEQLPVLVLPDGTIEAGVAWAVPPQPEDEKTVTDMIGLLAAAITRAAERQRLLAEAQTDPLTGVANRRHGISVLNRVLKLAEMSDDYACVVYLDLDNFKQVNDTFGHAAGDDVLRRFSDLLQGSVRKADTVIRMGGEEFMVVCPGMSQREALRVSEAIVSGCVAACASPLAPGWEQKTSIGLAVYPLAARDAEALMKAADMALYESKGKGGNTVSAAAELRSKL